MKRLIIILMIVASIVSCKDEIQLQPIVQRLKKIITYSSIHKNEIQSITTFEYDINGNLYEETNYGRDTANPQSFSLFEYENGKKIREYTYSLVREKFILNQEHCLQYDGNLLIKEEMKAPTNQKTISSIEYQYDKNGNLVFKSKLISDSLVNWKELYVFNSNNLRAKTIYFNEKLDTSEYIEHYYQNNHLFNDKVFNSENKLCYEFNYTYDSDNNLIEKTKTINGVTKVIESMTYLGSNLVEKTVYDWTYNQEYIYRFKYIQVFEYE